MRRRSGASWRVLQGCPTGCVGGILRSTILIVRGDSRLRLGIRLKRCLAIGVIAAMAGISSLISFGFFGQVRGALGLVAERSIPAVTAALTLSDRKSTRLNSSH